MKENFTKCLEIVLKHEGGFVNHPKDPGGATNLGITKKTYEDWIKRPVSIDEIKALTAKDVTPIYKEKYWNVVKGDDLISGIDLCVFDFAVNAGPKRAATILQSLLGVTVDGSIGPKTTQALKMQHNPVFLVVRYQYERSAFYKTLKNYDTFGKGWERRVKEVADAALKMISNS